VPGLFVYLAFRLEARLVKAIIFDCDGVLVDSEIVGLDDVVAYLADHGFEWDAKHLISTFTGMRDDVFSAALRSEYERILDRPASDAEAHALFEGLVEKRRAKRDTLQAVPGAEKSVRAVKALDGIKTAVASSSRMVYLDRKLKHCGLWDYFAPDVYSAEAVAHGKPAPDIFLYTAERIGIDPAACLVIEDAHHGVAAAKAAGMDVWGFTGGGHCFEGHGERLSEAGAARVIEHHDVLAQMLGQLARA